MKPIPESTDHNLAADIVRLSTWARKLSRGTLVYHLAILREEVRILRGLIPGADGYVKAFKSMQARLVEAQKVWIDSDAEIERALGVHPYQKGATGGWIMRIEALRFERDRLKCELSKRDSVAVLKIGALGKALRKLRADLKASEDLYEANHG